MASNDPKPTPSLRVISRSIVRPSSCDAGCFSGGGKIIHLTPWDLCHLSIEYIQKGILLPKPPVPLDLSRLVSSLSRTLDHFSPLAGRLSTALHGASLSVSVDCNGKGADLVFAAADDVTTTDVAGSLYTPEIVRSFFPLNGAICLDGHSLPLLAVQLTELSDGAIFLGCSANHAVLDGTSFWHFLNSWSEISRSECLGQTVISRPPILDRWFPDSIEPPVHLPFTDTLEFATRPEPCPDSARECFFHFPARSVKELKARANSEMSTSQISSLQALLAHLWRSVVRARKLEADRETAYVLLAGQRSRTVPPLPEAYFGNSVTGLAAIALAGDVESKGIGWVAWKLNRAVAAQSSKPVRGSLESWCKSPFFIKESRSSPCALLTGSSPRFDVYGNDFGWGRPVAVRSGGGGKGDGRVTVYPGAEEGSMALEVCLAAGVLASLVDDLEFMEAVGSGDSV